MPRGDEIRGILASLPTKPRLLLTADGIIVDALSAWRYILRMARSLAKSSSGLERLSSKRKREIVGLLLVLLALLTITSLATNSESDETYFAPSSVASIIDLMPQNSIGYAGMFFSHFAYYFFGLLAFFIPVWAGLWGGRLLLKWSNDKRFRQLYYASGAFFSISTLLALSAVTPPIRSVNYAETLGGLMAHLVGSLFLRIFGSIGTHLICIGAALVFLMLLVEWRPGGVGGKLKELVRGAFAWMGQFRIGGAAGHKAHLSSGKKSRRTKQGKSLWQKIRSFNLDFLTPGYQNEPAESDAESDLTAEPEAPSSSGTFVTDYGRIRDSVLSGNGTTSGGKSKEGKKKTVIRHPDQPAKAGEYQFPDLNLLNDNPQSATSVGSSELQQTADELLSTLNTFGIEVEGNRIERYPGPVITRYEFKPGTGIKVNQIINLSDDLALALRANRIRIIAPIPGKAAVGVEIPNRRPQMVYVRDILESDSYNRKELKLPLALGRTTSGEPYVTDLARMPHLLVAGATGSGKSVCLNVLITSLVYRHTPRSLRFLFVDPKMLELSVYKGLPHLERPVVTTHRQAERLLNDAVSEMEQRYKMLASKNVRNIEDFNLKAGAEEKLPYIVIVVDELADLMMSSASTRIETLITRLAQMARAVGIHLILATQRPSVDVITGLIKANFSARIAFQVATRIDSRTILDGNGAEKLLGSGDMLFLPPGQPEAIRIHGAFISSDETGRIVEHLKTQQVEVTRIDNFTEETSAKRQADLGTDPLLKEAAELVVRHKQGSVSLLQRRLGVGYQRAARLIDQLEEKKIVGVYDGSKAREVLVDEAYLERIMNNQ